MARPLRTSPSASFNPGSAIAEDKLFFLGGTTNVRGFEENMLVFDSRGDPLYFLIYLLWESGRFAKQKIGSLLDLGYSNVSRRIKETGKWFESNRKLCDEFKTIVLDNDINNGTM